MQGIIIQNISGLYQVLSEHACIRCHARGKFRKDNITLSAGDSVVFEMIGTDEGIINEILPRKNSFIRPNVANIDMICYVISARYPQPDPYLIDKMTVLASLKKVEIVLILNKLDLDDDRSANEVLSLYQSLGFTVIRCSATAMTRAEQILELTRGKTVVLTGNTGVGKSSIINTLGLGIQAKVEDISLKLGRGRHTTREVTFYLREDGGLLGDTPGFGNVDITLEESLTTHNLAEHFPEFSPWRDQCRFADCTHTGENGCIVADRVTSGDIAASRYQSYVQMFFDLEQRDQTKDYKKMV